MSTKPTVVFFYYNKVTNESFDRIAKVYKGHHKFIKLSQFGNQMDILDSETVRIMVARMMPFDIAIVGDVFCPTGQNLCREVERIGKKCFFLQHGQWIYTLNKRNPTYVPAKTFLMGNNIYKEVSSWPYAKRSKCIVTGSPRYDECRTDQGGKYIYFSPHVIVEKSPSFPDKINTAIKKSMRLFAGIDQWFNILIHPHYREGDVEFLKKTFPKAMFVEPSLPVGPLLDECRTVLTHRMSTIVLDAIARGKQVVLTNFEGVRYPMTPYPHGYFGDFALESNDRTQLEVNLASYPCKAIENFEEKAKDHIYLGNAADRIIAELEV